MDSNVINILIVGAGQIGSRHLEGAIKNKNQLSIIIVDKHPIALKTSENLIKNKSFGNSQTSVTYKKELPKNKSFDICIIATRADIRASITKDLLNNCNFKFMIFEKVLFQKDQDFIIISNMLREKNVKAWVNCPRRIYSFYQEIKKKINSKLPVNINVTGSSWDMACNAIHFIDLFSFLVSDSSLNITETNFSENVLKSKRGENFYEINGLIKCIIGKHSLLLSCDEKKDPSLHVKIKNADIDYSIDEVSEILVNNINDVQDSKKIKIPYQSDITGDLINTIINKKCGLVSYENSCKHHIPLLGVFRKHLSKTLNKEFTECPIT
ncbi:Gfo/Idh/MocA family oxidoreductase [Candidatus Pelagibacter sp.]|nr:Gfo/Idh/MocA family oxidoreductase [Candidatus Pelagibacter sp.]